MGSDAQDKAQREKYEKDGKPQRQSSLIWSIITPANLAVACVLLTLGFFYKEKIAAAPKAKDDGEDNSNYVMGLLIAGVALIGNAMVGALRKILSQHNIGSAQQVGLATLIQGIAAIAHCIYNGDLDIGPNFVESLPPKAFWIAAATGSVLNSVVKTLETKAFSETDMSLCAPFLAFDPVMQFVVGVLVIPAACAYVGFGCDETGKAYPTYHVFSVASIALGAFWLGAPKQGMVKKAGVKYLGPLPMGSAFILLNCVIYSFTSRLDKLAIKSAGKTLYYAYGRLLMASTTLGGSFMSGGLTQRELKKFMHPRVMVLVLSICAADAIYMLSLYQAFAWISPVYVTAIKRGGGILLSSLLGVALFGETIAGRTLPILVIVLGVTFLCL
mmetsp:Transcript_65935/g.162264  ORF Transcript_65935/g.162264 Transcript_65935/m.162264 type:complete len:386 (+) Transcript_65935:313-1470(+)